MAVRSMLLALAALSSAAALRAAPSMSISVGEKFPAASLSKLGCSGQNAVVYFYGADEAPSCTKQAQGFSDSIGDFAGVKVVGVRNDAGVKDGFEGKYAQSFYVDVGDEIRNEIGIPKDLFVLGGRETYVVDASGTVVGVHNNQFDPASHVTTALAAAETIPNLNPLEQFAASLGIELP